MRGIEAPQAIEVRVDVLREELERVVEVAAPQERSADVHPDEDAGHRSPRLGRRGHQTIDLLATRGKPEQAERRDRVLEEPHIRLAAFRASLRSFWEGNGNP